MGNLIKMDFYRMFKSRSFLISSIVLFLLAVMARVLSILMNKLAVMVSSDNKEMLEQLEASAKAPISFCSLIQNPFMFAGSIVVVLISAVVFSYADIANGYIKNIAGQVSKKGYTVLSKFVVLCVHNLFFMLVGVLGNVIIHLLTANIEYDIDHLALAIGTFAVKWVLVMSLSAILLFITTGLKNKTLASVVGVILGSGTLMVVHLMLDNTVENIMHFNPSEYDPSMLLNNANILIVNSLVVSLVIMAVFIPLTVQIFNKTDVK